MAGTPFLSEIRIFSFNFAPKGWAMCNGQSLPINQNQALFSLLGTTYGGNGQTDFLLPNLQGRVPIHIGNGHTLGERAGEEIHTLLLTEMPQHTHPVQASSNGSDAKTALNNYFASSTGFTPYNAATNEQMATNAITPVGGSQPHTNMAPFSVLNICIALQGIFPSQN